MTTSGAVKMYATGTMAGILGLTRGADEAVWFTDGIDIDRVTTAGAVTVWLSVYLGPTSITTGPDGALWGLASDGDVQRIETSRLTPKFHPPRYATTEYALRHAVFFGGITTAPDGALWFVEDSSIGRITTSGALSEYPITPTLFITGTLNSSRSNIVVGGDGALWFEISGNRIGRITTAGAVTEYPIPSPPTYGITAGPDGSIWFPVTGEKIGRLSPARKTATDSPGNRRCSSVLIWMRAHQAHRPHHERGIGESLRAPTSSRMLYALGQMQYRVQVANHRSGHSGRECCDDPSGYAARKNNRYCENGRDNNSLECEEARGAKPIVE
jgi:virginiamycin B lyase